MFTFSKRKEEGKNDVTVSVVRRLYQYKNAVLPEYEYPL